MPELNPLYPGPGGLEIRGHQAYREPAGFFVRAAALAADLAAALALFAVISRAMAAAPVPDASWIAGVLGACAGLWLFSRVIFGRTLGEAVWKARAQPGSLSDRLSFRVYRSDGLTPRTSARALVATAAGWVLAVIAGGVILSTHPLLARAERWTLAPSAEALGTGDATVGWTVAPFYYALGAWPTRIDGKPVFHSIPYEKGPPTRFIGHVIAKWDAPDVRLIFEGPRTPRKLATGQWQRSNLEDCLTQGLLSPRELSSQACLELRSAELERHFAEFRRLGLGKTSMKWLVVKNPALRVSEQVQGVYLSATNGGRGEDRFVLVMPNGASQTFILDYRENEEGRRAKEIFASSIRSLRVSNDLGQGKRWSDERIQDIRLDDLKTIQDPAQLAIRLAEIQAMLISRLSVDPATFDTYFHLAGTASLLAREGIREKRDEWSAAAKSLIDSIYRFAKDVAPNDPRIPQLEGLWVQMKRT